MAPSTSTQSLPLVVIDAANVVGSRPDGWWLDRIGANIRLQDALQLFRGIGFKDLPGPLEVLLVVEGAAKGIASIEGVQVESAVGETGDDNIVKLVNTYLSRRPIVVTNDRELRERVTVLGASFRSVSTVPRKVTDTLTTDRPPVILAEKKMAEMATTTTDDPSVQQQSIPHLHHGSTVVLAMNDWHGWRRKNVCDIVKELILEKRNHTATHKILSKRDNRARTHWTFEGPMAYPRRFEKTKRTRWVMQYPLARTSTAIDTTPKRSE